MARGESWAGRRVGWSRPARSPPAGWAGAPVRGPAGGRIGRAEARVQRRSRKSCHVTVGGPALRPGCDGGGDGCDGGGDGCDGGGDGCDGGGDGPKVGASAAQATPRAVTVGDPPARRGRSVTD